MFHYLEICRYGDIMTIEQVETLCKKISPDSFVEGTGFDMVLVKFPSSQPSVVEIARVFPKSEIKPIPNGVPVTIVTL